MSVKQLPNYVQALLDKIIAENGFVDYSLELKSGSNAGDGFLSELTSITILENGNDSKRLDIVCKIAPLNENRRKEFFSNVVFDRESYFYTKVMPTFARFQEEKNVPVEDQFRSYPKCYAAVADDDSEQYVIIMEDLRPQGFKMWNKAKPASIENLRMVVTELGKLHGLSIAMKDQRPNEFLPFKRLTDISTTFFQSQNMQGMFNGSFDRAIEVLLKEEHKELVRILKKDTLSHFVCCLNEEKSDRFGVVSHGDFWNNNILYRFDNKDVAEDIRILDWQLIRYISPAIDLVYNIFTSTDKALRDKEYENLLRLYHESLSHTVKLLGSDPDQLFTFVNLQDELKSCGTYAFLLAPMLLQVSLADSSELSNLDEMSDRIAEGEKGHELITGLDEKAQQAFSQRLNDVFDHLFKLGYHHEIY